MPKKGQEQGCLCNGPLNRASKEISFKHIEFVKIMSIKYKRARHLFNRPKLQA
jgi:hypothetical protein